MDILKDILPMTTFRNHSANVMQHLKKTRRPVILTVNGKAAAVVQDAEAYQHLLDLAAEASAAEGIRQGLEDLKRGQTRPASEVFRELRGKHGVPRSLDDTREPRPRKPLSPHRCRQFRTGEGLV